jgi:glycosyltransferase involved in cell wall biosynthesis
MSARSDGSILILSGVRGDTRRYRILHLGEQLRLAGLQPVVTHLSAPDLLSQAHGARIAVLHRVAYDRTVKKLLEILRQQGALVVLDADDFLYDPGVMRWIDSPDFQDPVRAAIYRRELLRHRETLEHCDAISVSTGYLAELLAPFDKPVIVQRNAFNLEMLVESQRAAQARPEGSQRVVIGYASGTRTHDRDLAMIRPALQAVLERYPHVDLYLLGALAPGQDWGGLQGRVQTFPLVPWRQLPARLAQLDINLAPLLPESPFNQAKSEIKFMEAALVRVPTVATPTDAFAHAIQHGQNGMLAENLAGWQANLERLIENSAERRAMGEAAYQDVLERYSPWARGQQVVENLAGLSRQLGKGLPDLVANPLVTDMQESLPVPQFSPADERHPNNLDLARYTVRNRGLPILAGQVWVFFRRLVAPVFPFKSGIPTKGGSNEQRV